MKLGVNYTMIERAYFFDTYAFIEIYNKNPGYFKYANCCPILTKLNLYEVYYTLLRLGNKEVANSFLREFYDLAIDYDKSIIARAAEFKIYLKKRNISMVDSIGYFVALEKGIKFLTGDKQFEGMYNVEFVK